MLLARLVEASADLSATRSRIAKRELIAGLLRHAAGADESQPSQLELVATYLSGELRQRRTGVGWRRLMELPVPAQTSSITLTELDDALEAIAGMSGPGSSTARTEALHEVMARATQQEQDYLRALMTGNLRQGALDSVMLDAVAQAFDVPAPAVRRAAFLGGSTPAVALAAAEQQSSGVDRLGEFRIVLGRPMRPMLASSAPDIATATAGFNAEGLFVDTKLDGIRIQAHRDGDVVRLYSRSLDDVTGQFPDLVSAIKRLAAHRFILDGEALAMRDGVPEPFQVSASRGHAMTAYFFDALHLSGRDLIDEPATVRFDALAQIVPETMTVPRVLVTDTEAAQDFFAATLRAGHEGVVLKDPAAPYAAGRRGAAWVKVKPRHTFDLVVLAVERGSGRRRGYLSNIHLGARDPTTGGFVMVGKTFKGMTDETLAWQTERFTELAVAERDHVVSVRPVQVVEIAIDGVQRSTRYPGGVALRFARVLRYRHDKQPDQADTVESLRALGSSAP